MKGVNSGKKGGSVLEDEIANRSYKTGNEH
jgi:hypothetical protein